MAIVDIIKSWFGKNKKPTIAPSPTPKQTQAKKAVATPSKAAILEKPLPKKEESPADPSNASSNNLMTMLNNPQTAFSVKQIALQKVEDANLLAELAAHHKIAKIRQQAANQLNDFTLIQKVANQVKHSDKGVYRILRQKIDAQDKQQKGQEEYTQRLTQICIDLEHHLQSAHTPLFAAKVQSLQQQWQQHTEQKSYTLTNDLQQRFEAASTQAQQKVTAEQTEKALFEQQKSVTHAFLVLESDVLLIDTPNKISELSEKLNALSYDWQYCTQHTAADKQLLQQVQKSQQILQKYSDLFQQTTPHIETMLQHHQQLIDSPINQTAYDALQALLQNTELLNTKLTLPALFSPIIESFNTAQTALTAYQNAQAKSTESTPYKPPSSTKNTASHPELEKLLLQIAEHFNQGQSKEADKVLRKAQKYAKTHHLFDPRLGDWLQELQKMKDWAGFAILPKKEELVAQMKMLAEHAEAETDPLTQLDKIKQLQAEWQALGTVYNDAEKALWEEFKSLSQSAYAPCQHYFDEQNAIQEQNATARQKLCDELQEYLDNLPSEVNWQGHIAILKQAREDWQKYHPVEAKKHKQLQSRFTRIIKALEDKLHAEYELQETQKRALITEATQLLNHENMYEACQKAKELQNTWKTLGFCGHQKEQALWEEFRQQCDALFAKRGAQKEAQKLEEQATTQQAEQILTQLHTLLNTPEHSPNITQVNGLIEAFQGLFLPKEVNHALRKRFTVLAQQWQSYLDTQVNLQKQAQLKQIETALELCVTAEQRVLSGSPVTLDIVLTWQGLVVPQPFKSTLQKRWQSISSLKKSSPEDTQARDQKALDACLLLELLLDIDSPDSERLARTAKKMELFEQQNYPKTAQEAQALVSQTLQNLLLISCLSDAVNTQINQRVHLVLQSPALSKLL
jgi:DNA repair protein SbcC/Rad50